MKKRKPRDKSAKFFVPIYDFHFEIVLCRDIVKAHNLPSRSRFIGKYNDEDTIGLWSYRGRRSSMFFTYGHTTHKIIAHELIHAVHAMLERNGVPARTKEDHETPALLQEYLAGLIYNQFKKWKIKIK